MHTSTDYLVVGAGASGLAFTDSLVAETDAEVTLIDRRHAVGGHWVDAYPFVRLHIPSAYYGVNSLPFGEDRIDDAGENAGFYERAPGEEVREHFAAAAERLTATGRVRILTGHEHLGRAADREQIRDLASGAVHEIDVQRKVVDARYLEASVPATHKPSFEVCTGRAGRPGRRAARRQPTPALSYTRARVRQDGGRRVHVATGQRRDARPHPVDPTARGLVPRSRALPAARAGRPASSRASPSTPRRPPRRRTSTTSSRGSRPRGATTGSTRRGRPRCTAARCSAQPNWMRVRQVQDVVRLGHVRRIEADRMVSTEGEVETGDDVLHVDCTAAGLRDAPPRPIFQPGRIVLQQVRQNSPCFNAALVGFVEAHREDDEDKNHLCPPNPYASSIEDWPAPDAPHLGGRVPMAERARPGRPGSPRADSTSSAPCPSTRPSRPSKRRFSAT